MFHCRARRVFRLVRPTALVLAMAGFLAGTIGIPLPQIATRDKDRSRPYPCMDHACGCASAEQCWRSCCCFTNREKVAWAAKQGVALPPYVIAAAQREQATAATPCCASGSPR